MNSNNLIKIMISLFTLSNNIIKNLKKNDKLNQDYNYCNRKLL